MRRLLKFGTVATFLVITASLFQAAEELRLEVQQGHLDSITAATFSNDGKLAATGSDRVITLWDLTTNRQIYQLHGDWEHITSLVISDDKKLLVGARRQGASASQFDL